MSNDQTDQADEQLRAAFDALIEDLQRARDAIDQPELMPPPASDRTLAEGYRYLAGYLHGAIERAFFEEPGYPVFRNALSVLNRGTIDNADAIYFYAPIEGSAATTIRGHVADHRHWRGEAPAATGPKAPLYVIFEVTCGEMTGDTGDLRELQPGRKARTGMLDSTAIQVDDDGWFEILLAPDRPDGHTGNFIPTARPARKSADGAAPATRYANYVSGRQLFGDWAREEPIHLEAELVARDIAPRVLDAELAAEQLRRCGALVRGQMQFWNAFWTILMGTYGERQGTIPGTAFPRNAFNSVNAASGATGGGMSTNLYAGGVFELGEDDALVIEMRPGAEPLYFGIQLANLWGESADYTHRLGSLNGQQCEVDADGVTRIVVAHRDPGVANWLDTSELAEGFLSVRWAFETPPPENEWPAIEARPVPFRDVRGQLPGERRAIAPDERQLTIGARRRHVERRFRSF